MKVLAHMPVRISIPDVMAHFLAVVKGSNEVNYLLSVYDPNPNPMTGTTITLEGRKNIEYKMETARRIAINEGYDYLFNVEHDNVVPVNALVDLLATGKDLVSGVYRYRHSKKSSTPIMPENVSRGAFTDVDLDKGVLPAHLIPWGCTLFARNVLTKIPFTRGLDGEYTTECEKAGIKRWVNMDVKVGHIDIAQDGSITEIKV